MTENRITCYHTSCQANMNGAMINGVPLGPVCMWKYNYKLVLCAKNPNYEMCETLRAKVLERSEYDGFTNC